MRCPKCNGEVLLTATATDSTGEDIILQYHCDSCKTELIEKDILDLDGTNYDLDGILS